MNCRLLQRRNIQLRYFKFPIKAKLCIVWKFFSKECGVGEGVCIFSWQARDSTCLMTSSFSVLLRSSQTCILCFGCMCVFARVLVRDVGWPTLSRLTLFLWSFMDFESCTRLSIFDGNGLVDIARFCCFNTFPIRIWLVRSLSPVFQVKGSLLWDPQNWVSSRLAVFCLWEMRLKEVLGSIERLTCNRAQTFGN